MDEQDELTELTREDRDRPTLFSFFLLEFLKWGGLLLVLYVLFNFAEPLWRPIYDLCRSMLTGDPTQPP